MKELKIKYLDAKMPKLNFVEGDKSDWIDLMCLADLNFNKNDFQLVNLGVVIKLPDGYEAHVVPRSSTFKKYGLLQTNSMGVIDGSYCGNDDIWHWPALATRDIIIPKYTRLCQFRIIKCMPKINFKEVDYLDGQNRGGFGSTGH